MELKRGTASSPSRWSHLGETPVIVYTVTSIGDWVVGLLKLSLIDSVQDFCLPASSYPLRINQQTSFLANCGMVLAQKKAKSTIGFEGEQSKTL